jgi:hypothetical protein
MIRANLLPPPRDALRVLGATVDRRYAREGAIGLVVLCAVAALTFGIECWRASALQAQAVSLERLVAEDAPRRRELAAAAIDVARLEQLQREADARRRSGNDVAATLIAIGNAMPARVWLDGIERGTNGFTVDGGAPSLDDVGDALVSVARWLPRYVPSITSIARADGGGSLHFSVQLQAAPRGAQS